MDIIVPLSFNICYSANVISATRSLQVALRLSHPQNMSHFSISTHETHLDAPGDQYLFFKQNIMSLPTVYVASVKIGIYLITELDIFKVFLLQHYDMSRQAYYHTAPSITLLALAPMVEITSQYKDID